MTISLVVEFVIYKHFDLWAWLDTTLNFYSRQIEFKLHDHATSSNLLTQNVHITSQLLTCLIFDKDPK